MMDEFQYRQYRRALLLLAVLVLVSFAVFVPLEDFSDKGVRSVTGYFVKDLETGETTEYEEETYQEVEGFERIWKEKPKSPLDVAYDLHEHHSKSD